MKMHCVEIKFNLVCFINSAKTLYIYHNTELTLHYGICLQRVSLHTYIERNIFLFVQVHQDTEWIKIFARYSIPYPPSKDTIYGCSGVFNVFILISSSGVGGIAGSDVSVAALLRKTCVLCAGLLNCDVDTVMNTEDSR